MTQQIEQAMESDIKQLDLDERRRPRSRRSRSCTPSRNKIGYPDQWRDYCALEDRAAAISSATSIARDRLRDRSASSAKIGKPVDRGEWGMTPPTVNAYYNPQMNDINFPAGVLQPPLYDPKMDDAPNYGNTGAHHRPRADARLRRRRPPVRRARAICKDWWTPEDAKEFEKRAALRRATSTRSTRSSTTSRSTASSPWARTSPTSAARSSPTSPGRSDTASQKLEPRRRLHARPALLRRLRAVGLRERAPGEPAASTPSPTRTRPASTASTAWW